MLIPFAIKDKAKMRERGDYAGGQGPRGAIVHFTAGHSEHGIVDAFDAIDGGVINGYTYLCIARTGELVQAHDVMKWGYHAGESAWNVKLKRLSWNIVGSVSDDLIGIEMNNAGLLTKVGDEFFPWWAFKDKKLVLNAKPIPEDQIRFVIEENYGCPTGYYHKYTPEQESTLIRTLMWLYVNVEPFKLEYVLGHHEVAGIKGIGYWRKSDPGGSLSLPMDVFRNYLIENKQALIAKYQITKVSP